MGSFTDILIAYGYWGMLVMAMLAASIIPISSEAVMVALMAAGLSPWYLVIYGTLGSVIGSAFNYGIGMLGRLDWIERYLHVRRKDIDKAERFMAGHGAWIGFFSFLPIVGDGITVALGLMRANVLKSFISVSLGKFVRYVALTYGAHFFF